MYSSSNSNGGNIDDSAITMQYLHYLSSLNLHFKVHAMLKTKNYRRIMSYLDHAIHHRHPYHCLA